MLDTKEIDALFHYTTENKFTDEDKREKNDRRFEAICRRVPEVRHAIYDSKKGIIDSIQIVNEHYASILNEDDIYTAMSEIKTFHKIISNSHIDIVTKATIIRNFDFKEYKKILHFCKYTTGLKSISRLNNMKTMTTSFLQGNFDKRLYFEDLREQINFFSELVSKYEDISVNNFYVYVLRYDLKTIKKKTIRTRGI